MIPTGLSHQILIVDDEPNVRLVFRTTLEFAGFAVAEAEHGAMALDVLAETPAELVLLDLQMPQVGGMEFLRRLRDTGNDVPVVIITAYGSIPDAVQAMRLGAIDFLSKPINPMHLRQVVDEVIQRHSVAAPESGSRAVRSPAPDRARYSTTVTISPAAVDLSAIKRALNRREFDEALEGLEEALELVPDSAEAHTLMGVLRETLGQPHAAYRAYRLALQADPHYSPAVDNMKQYCARFNLDARNVAINPGAGS
jgi:DNA-binding response OmpR family regulator